VPTSYTIHTDVSPRYRRWAPPALLAAAARAALRHQQAPQPAALTIRLTGDAELRRLNRQFLGQDHVTDVLSFPSGTIDPETGRLFLGDIAIAYPRTRLQAARARHPVRAELRLLVIHGVLHLLGHDHAQPAEKSHMWAAQDAILATLK
jgi:probable rRNA maturation factor